MSSQDTEDNRMEGNPPGDPDDGEVQKEEDDQVAAKPLGDAILALPYIPDFPMGEVQFWFAPDFSDPQWVYHELTGRSADKWETYYTKKGWNFVHRYPAARDAEGPYRAEPGKMRLRILKSGKIFAPRPCLLQGGREIPFASLDKRRPINPWKPNYIKALNFIKKYEWPHPLPDPVPLAIWEIEECGEVAGSTSWQNAEMLLEDNMTANVQATLVDIFEKRPEDFSLGSEVYLRVLGRSGEEGFQKVLDLHNIPFVRKRKHVAMSLGKLGKREGLDTLLVLLDDEDPEVRSVALRSLGSIGISSGDSRGEKLKGYLEDAEIAHRVWSAQALLKGGDESQKKFLINLVKEQDSRPLSDMGELGHVLRELNITEAVPFLINRLKSDNLEIRADAAEALREITSLQVEFYPEDGESRRQAIRAYNRWWDDLKRKRRRDRGK